MYSIANIYFILVFFFIDSKFHRSDGVAAVTWCLAAFIFVNIYSSCLTAYTSLVFQRPDIVSFQDLASNPRYEVVTMKYTLTERIFLVIMFKLLLDCEFKKKTKLFSIACRKRVLEQWKKLGTKCAVVVMHAESHDSMINSSKISFLLAIGLLCWYEMF